MIGFLVLALCFTSLNSQYTAQYTYEDEYKTLLYEMSGTFGGSIVETIVNGEVVDHVSHSYTSNIWPVNTTIFPGKEVFFVKEQVSTDIVRKSLFTVYREDSTKVIINRYNFTTGVSPPDDPTSSTFFQTLTLASFSNLNNRCNGTLNIVQKGGKDFTGSINLCEVNKDNPPTYYVKLGCSTASLFSENAKGNYTDYYTSLKARRTFPPGWDVRQC